MSRINIWVSPYIYGSIRQVAPDVRSVFVDYLALAAKEPEIGKVCMNVGVGYTEQELAKLLNVPLSLIKKANVVLRAPDPASDDGKPRISVDRKGVIDILKWEQYQPPWEKKKGYASQQPEVKKATKKDPAEDKAVLEIFDFYKDEVLPGSRQSEGHLRKIRTRLTEFTQEELKRAIVNFAACHWRMSHNADKGASWFFKSEAQVNKWMELIPSDENDRKKKWVAKGTGLLDGEWVIPTKKEGGFPK